MRVSTRRQFGWGGWTRTNTVLINSEVSYQLDHAPTEGFVPIPRMVVILSNLGSIAHSHFRVRLYKFSESEQ